MTDTNVQRILIVEDEALVALEMEAALTSAGYAVVGTTDTLDDTLTAATAGHPDLALCDIRLPGVSGVEIARRLEAIGVPSLFVTGNCQAAVGARVGLGCLHKPFNQSRLLSALAVATAIIGGTAVPPLPDNMHLFV